MTSAGEQDERSGEYNQFFLCPAQDSLLLKRPLRIEKLRSTSCDPNCFRSLQPGTIFPVEPSELDGILKAVVQFFPEEKKKLEEWT